MKQISPVTQNIHNKKLPWQRLSLPVFSLAIAAYSAHGMALTTYTMTDLSTVSSGAIVGIAPTAVNAAGQLIGTGTNPANVYPLYAQTSLLYSPNGSLIDTQALANGAVMTGTLDINTNSLIAGSGRSGVGVPNHAFVRNSDGTGIDLGTLAGDYSSVANAINNNGQVVGNSSTVKGVLCETRAFIGNVNNAGLQPVGTLGGSWNYAFDINSLGQVVGTSSYTPSTCSGNTSHAYISTATGLRDLHAAGMLGVNSAAYKINDVGQVVGSFATGLYTAGTGSYYPNGFPISHAVVWDTVAGTYTDLGLGIKDSALRAINANGLMVGYEKNYSTASFVLSPAIVSENAVIADAKGGGLIDLNTLVVGNSAGWNIVDAKDINDAGQIIANARDANGVTHGVLLNPTTTPVGLPAAPANLTVSATSSSLDKLGWVDNANNETAQYLERCQGAGCTNFTRIAALSVNATAYADTPVSPATTYNYRVQAHGVLGDSAYSNTATVTTPTAAPTVAPVAPSNLVVTAVATKQVVVGWLDNANNEQNYLLERCTGLTCTNFSKIATLAANVTTYSNTGLARKTNYRYRVRASNAIGKSAYSNIVTAKTL